MNVLKIAIRKIILDGSILILFFRVALDLVAWRIKNLPAQQESQVWFLGWEDSLEKGMATRSSTAWESRGKRSLAGYSPPGQEQSDMAEQLTLSLVTSSGNMPEIIPAECESESLSYHRSKIIYFFSNCGPTRCSFSFMFSEYFTWKWGNFNWLVIKYKPL